MTEDLLPAELALPADALVPIPEEVLNQIAEGGESWPVPMLADRDEAEWVMRRLAHAKRFISEQAAQRDAWIARVRDWYAETTGPVERQAAFMEATLEHYAIVERERTKQATVKVPSGEVWTRAAKEPHVVIEAEDELLAYLTEALDPTQWADVVRTTQAVRVSELAKVVDVIEADGELLVLFSGERVPGVTAVPPKTTSGVRPDIGTPALTR